MPVPTASLPLPPGPVGLPLVGSALHFIGPFSRSPHAVLTRLAETHGTIMSFRPGMAGSFVVVSSPAAAREALVDNDAALAARFVPDVARAMGHSSESLFFLPNSSPLWKQHRATVGAHMSAARSLDATRHIRDRHARGLILHKIEWRMPDGMDLKDRYSMVLELAQAPHCRAGVHAMTFVCMLGSRI